MRLRKHFSLANDDVWQRCADKLIAALGNMPARHQPLVALLLPEKPEVAHEIARHFCGQKGLYALEWLKLTVTDAQVLADTEKYYRGQLGRYLMITMAVTSGVRQHSRARSHCAGPFCPLRYW